MIVSSPTELRNNFKKERMEDPYFDNPENIKAIKRSLEQAKAGKVKKLTSIDDLLSKSSF
ncbi:MAG: hypothetical protein LBL24_04830 [Bacteroidales bacterium]|jgi:hypothetical protein|nr:hypothetical protein [Bacteroidales bacterium]